MKIPYHFDFNNDSSPQTILPKLPPWCKYSLKSVETPHSFIRKDAEIISQQLNDKPFLFDLVAFSIENDTTIPFKLHDKNLFMYFMLEGEATICNREDDDLMHINQKNYFLSVAHPGTYKLKARAGTHIVLVVTICPEWMQKKLSKLSKIQEIIEMFHTEELPPETLFQCRIDPQIDTLLDKIFNYSKENLGVSDGYLITCISSMLAHYNKKINTGLAIPAKEYIDNNYRDPLLNVSMLAEYLCTTPQTLRNHFIRKYDMSVQRYYTTLRMEHALALRKEGLSDTAIYEQVGYVNLRSFQSTFNRYMKRKRL